MKVAPELMAYVAGLKTRGRGTAVTRLRRLLSMVREYPRAPLVAAIEEALRFGLFDLERVERMMLRRIGEDFFYLTRDDPGECDEP
jgi:hypothetical protein